MATNAFNTAGATPTLSSLGFGTNTGTSPYNTALTNMAVGGTSTSPTHSSLSIAPSTPLKSTSFTDTTGNTTVNTYHPPTSGMLSGSSTPSSSAGSYKGVAITPGSDAQIAAQIAAIDAKGTATNTATQSSAPPPTVNPNASMQNVSGGAQGTPVTYAGLVNNLSNQQNSTQNQQAQQSTTALNNLSATNPGTSGPAFDAYQKAVQNLQNLKSQIASQYANVENSPIPLEFQQGREQVMSRQYASQLDAAQQAVNEAQASLGYQISGQQTQNSGYGTAGNLALTGQGQAQSALGTAASLAAPQQYGLTTQPYNPLTNTIGGAGGQSAIDRAINAGNISTAQNFAQDYQTGLANLKAADSIQSQIVNTLSSNPTLNNQPLSAITNLKELISGQVSSGPQQLLSQQIAQYISTLGLDPATVTSIASQQQGTLAQLLDSLRTTAQAKVESKNPTNLQGASGSNSFTIGQTAAGGSLKWDGSQWVKA